jgi:hypothetical protein
MLCENSNVAGCYSRCRNVSSKLNDSSFRIVAAAGERRAVARLRRRDEDRFMDKYTPDRRISALRRLSVALHLALPAFGLTFIWGWSAETGREHWFSWLVCAAAYLIYAVFAILLHKEHYPERSAIAARLAFAPLVLSGLYFKFLDPSFLGWLVAAGLAYFFGVTLAIWTLFAFGSRLAPVDATAGPGQSRLRWRPDGRSPLLEVRAAWDLLAALGRRRHGPEVYSCPTCGRTRIDVARLARQVELALGRSRVPVKVAVMGCVVNGPGEAREADFGIAGGRGRGVVFARGRIVKTCPESQLARELVQLVRCA